MRPGHSRHDTEAPLAQHTRAVMRASKEAHSGCLPVLGRIMRKTAHPQLQVAAKRGLWPGCASASALRLCGQHAFASCIRPATDSAELFCQAGTSPGPLAQAPFRGTA